MMIKSPLHAEHHISSSPTDARFERRMTVPASSPWCGWRLDDTLGDVGGIAFDCGCSTSGPSSSSMRACTGQRRVSAAISQFWEGRVWAVNSPVASAATPCACASALKRSCDRWNPAVWMLWERTRRRATGSGKGWRESSRTFPT